MNIDHRGFNMNVRCQCCDCGRKWKWNNSKFCQSDSREGRQQLREIHLDLASGIFLSGCDFEDGALNMVGDGSFDSRGRSALYLRYVLMDSKYHLALDFEIVRQKTGEKRYDMEKEGFEKSFSRLVEEASKYLEPGAVKSFTSDRSKSIATSMRLNFPQIEHNFDSWHYIRNITLDIMKADSVWDQLIPVTDDDKMSDSSYEYESDLDTRASDIDSVWDHLVLMDDEGENLDDLEESEDDESYELRRDLRQ
ncbi:hypothetical protein L5515_009554 [Caenorhabditis briggsae]|uniref:Uncharacterized protein n=1 Tax=Caenorhabditis briggsae TaxID=6238 RepID=A0AAE9F8I6_CAEBR|nr:hypothetical protein L5515_009554 [Caenorhabditis briggsae]